MKILPDLLRSPKMANMDGIKGSSKEPNLFLTGCGFFLYRLSPFGFRFLFFKIMDGWKTGLGLYNIFLWFFNRLLFQNFMPHLFTLGFGLLHRQ